MLIINDNFEAENNAAVLEPRYSVALSFSDDDSLDFYQNVLLQSDDFSTTWSEVGAGLVTTNTDADPDGVTIADTLTDDNASGYESINQAASSFDVTKHWTATLFVKKDTTGRATRFARFRLYFTGATTENNLLDFDTSTGETNFSGASTDAEASVEVWNSDWWRIRITAKSTNQSNSQAVVQIYPARGASTTWVQSTSATGSIVVCRAQLSSSRSAIEYVATTTAEVVGGSPDSDVFWLTSHADALVLPGTNAVDKLASSIADRGIGGSTQRIMPETGKHTIGSVTLRILDVGGALSDRINDRLAGGEGLRHKQVRIYKGYKALTAWSDYVAYMTHIIDSVDYHDGVYTITCSDIQRTAKKKIFEPHQGVLTSTISASAESIPITIAAASSKFPLVAHDNTYSANPSDSVGYIQIDDEVICHDGWNGGFTAVNVIERGALGTTPATHVVTATELSQRKKVTEYIYLEMPAPKLIYALETGILHGQASNLPAHWSLEVPTRYVRLADFTDIGDDLWNTTTNAGRVLRFIGLEAVEAKKFIQEEICLWLNCFMPVYSDGSIGLKRYAGVLPASGYDVQIDESDIVKYGPLRHDMKTVKNNAAIHWNWIERLERYTKFNGLVDADSITKHGATELELFEFKGVFTGLQTDANIFNFFTALRDRFSNPPLRHSITVMPDLDVLEVGDTARVINPNVRDFNSLASLDRTFEIQQRSINWANGLVKFELFGGIEKSTEQTLSSSNVLADSFYTSAGTELSTVLTMTAGAITASGTLTGSADNSTSIFYYDGALTLNAGVTLTIERNVMLRVRGNFTVNGDIVIEGNAADGSVGVTNTGYSCQVYVWHIGQDQDEGASHLTKYRAGVQVRGVYPNGLPVFNVVNVDGSTLQGIPTDLAGVPGTTGQSARIFTGAGAWGSAFDRAAAGGAGGIGGGGLAVVCRGMSMGINATIDCSGTAGTAGSTAASDDVPGLTVYGQTGSGGFPGSILVLIDGDYSAPDFDSTNVTASRGGAPVPAAVDEFVPALLGLGEDGYGQDLSTDIYNYWEAVTRIQYIPEADNGFVWLPEDELAQVAPKRLLDELLLGNLVADVQSFGGPLTAAAWGPKHPLFRERTFIVAGDADATDTRIFSSVDAKTWAEESNPGAATDDALCAFSTIVGDLMVGGSSAAGGGFLLWRRTKSGGWTKVTPPNATPVNGIGYTGKSNGGGVFVLVGGADGTDAGIWIAGGVGGTYQEQTNPKSFNLNDCVWSVEHEILCAVGDADGTDAYLITSTVAGSSWTERSNPQNGNLQGVAAGNGLFVAVGDDGAAGPYIIYSSDGTSWTEASYPVNNETLARVRFVNGLFIAVGSFDDAVFGATLWISEDGANWARVPNPARDALTDLAFDGVTFVIPNAAATGEILKSARTDGV